MCEITNKHDSIQNQVKILSLIGLDEMQVRVKLVDPMEVMRKMRRDEKRCALRWSEENFKC